MPCFHCRVRNGSDRKAYQMVPDVPVHGGVAPSGKDRRGGHRVVKTGPFAAPGLGSSRCSRRELRCLVVPPMQDYEEEGGDYLSEHHASNVFVSVKIAKPAPSVPRPAEPAVSAPTSAAAVEDRPSSPPPFPPLLRGVDWEGGPRLRGVDREGEGGPRLRGVDREGEGGTRLRGVDREGEGGTRVRGVDREGEGGTRVRGVDREGEGGTRVRGVDREGEGGPRVRGTEKLSSVCPEEDSLIDLRMLWEQHRSIMWDLRGGGLDPDSGHHHDHP
ncbi:unnamed protein product [Gadus morhua 'NCC']